MQSEVNKSESAQSFELMATICDHAPALVAAYEVKTGNYIFVNNYVHQLLGYRKGELLQNGVGFVNELIHPDDIDTIAQAHARALERIKKMSDSEARRTVVGFEYRVKHKDGSWRWVHTDGTVLKRSSDGAIEQILNVTVDITPQKHKEAEMQHRLQNEIEERTRREAELQSARKRAEQSESRLSMAIGASQLGLWEWNVESNTLTWSKRLKRMYGMNPDEPITFEKYLASIHPDDRDAVQSIVNEAQLSGKEYKLEHRVVWPDGSVHWLQGQGRAYHKKGKTVKMLGTTMNIDERKNAQLALEESERRYSSLFNSRIIGVMMPSLDGSVHDANDTFLRMVGYTRAELKKGLIRWDELTPEEFKSIDVAKVKELRETGQAIPWEKEYVAKDGRRVPVTVGAIVLPGEGEICITFVLDRSQTKKYQEQLLQHQQRLEMAQQAAQIGTFEWSLADNSVLWTPELESIYGLPQGSFSGTYEAWMKLIHPEDRFLVAQAMEDAVNGSSTYNNTEFRIIHPNGSVRWLLGRGELVWDEHEIPVRFIGINLDITDRKAVEMRIKESEQRFRQMADSAPVLIWEAGTDMKTTWFNRAWLEYTGRTLNDELGDGWSNSVHKDDRARIMKIYRDNFNRRTAFSMEYRLRRHDGLYRWILDHGAPRISPSGEFLGYIGSCVEIEDYKRRRELEARTVELTRERQQLVELNQAKDEFISLASHQLRTPATAVKQYLGILLQGYAGDVPEHLETMLKRAYDNNERQLQIVEDLLRVARMDAGKIRLQKEPTDIGFFLKDIVSDQMQKFTERKQQIRVQVPQKQIFASIDANHMRMALENMIDNASKYSLEGSPISIKISQTPNEVEISISDKGVGISKADQKKLFQKFVRIHNDLSTLVGGSGLGLYWSKKIVDLHGGKIVIQSKEQVGSTFRIILPKQPAPTEIPQSKKPSRSTKKTGAARI